MNKKTILGLITLVVIIGAAIGGYLWMKPASTASDGPATFTIQPTELIAEFEKDTEGSNEKYVGQTIRFGGVVESIEGDSALLFKLRTRAKDYSANCSFDISEFANSSKVKVGDSVNLQGSCNGIVSPDEELDLFSEKSISFARCKLFDK